MTDTFQEMVKETKAEEPRLQEGYEEFLWYEEFLYSVLK